MSDMMKKLAKKRAQKDDDVALEMAKTQEYPNEQGVKRRENERMWDDMRSKPMDDPRPMPAYDVSKYPSDADTDHASRNPKVKQMRKFNMLKGLIGIMDEMD